MNLRALLLLLCALGSSVAFEVGHAEERPASAGITWVKNLDLAYAAARANGRPLLLAIHFRSEVGEVAWPEDPRAWNEIYRDPDVVERSRSFVCVQPPLRHAPPDGRGAEPIHLILDSEGRRIAGAVDWPHPPGRPSVEALMELMAGGDVPTKPSGDAPATAPTPDPRPGLGTGILERLTLPPEAEGVRIHLAFAGRVPDLPPGTSEIRALVLAQWDGGERREVGRVVLRAGEKAPSAAVDVRFETLRQSSEAPALGAHRIDVWLSPAPTAYRFSEEPLYAGVVYVDVQEGEGGGGGSGSEPESEPEEPEEEEPEPPAPPPDGPVEQPPVPPPDEGRTEVVDPLVRHDRDRVHKEDAVVAVPDPEAGLEPPPLVPLQDALRNFERVVERALGDERIRSADREFLLRYFRALGGRSSGEEGR